MRIINNHPALFSCNKLDWNVPTNHKQSSTASSPLPFPTLCPTLKWYVKTMQNLDLHCENNLYQSPLPPASTPTRLCTHLFLSVCWCWRTAPCLSGSCFLGTGCADVCAHRGIFLQVQSLSCTLGFPFCRGPSRSCRASRHGGWSFSSVYILCGWSTGENTQSNYASTYTFADMYVSRFHAALVISISTHNLTCPLAIPD